MSWLILNVGTNRLYAKKGCGYKAYNTERGAKGACTKLNKEYGDVIQWKVITSTEWNNRPVKMVERVNLMTGAKYMEPEDTPRSCSPASELYWSM